MAFNDIYMNNGVSLIDITPNMTSENTPSPYSVSATSYYNSAYAWKAFSGDVNDSWTASSNSGHITFDFNVNTEIDAVILFLSTGNNDFGGKTVKIQGSYDNVGYYDLWQEQNPITGSERIVQLNQRYNYRYYRVDVQGGSNWFGIYSIRFLKINQSDKKLTIHKTLKANLKQTVDAGIKELHLTEDGGFYTYDKDGNLVQIGHDHENKDVLEKLTLGTNGELLFDGKTIEVDIDLTDYMKISEYASAINQGSVAKADKALELDGVKQAQPLMYYGTDSNGNVGFHYIPIDKNTKDGEIEQRVILNASAGVSHIVESKNDMSDGKAFIQAYKFVAGEQNVIKTIKEFNNKDSSNFYYDKNGIVFEDTCRIKNNFDVTLKKKNDLYVSNIIKKDDYCKIESILER